MLASAFFCHWLNPIDLTQDNKGICKNILTIQGNSLRWAFIYLALTYSLDKLTFNPIVSSSMPDCCNWISKKDSSCICNLAQLEI